MNADQPELPAEVRDVAEKVIDAYHTAGSHEKGILSGASVLAPLWPKVTIVLDPHNPENTTMRISKFDVPGTHYFEGRSVEPKPPQHLAGVSGNMVETKADAALTPSEPPPSVAEPTSEGWTRVSVPPQPVPTFVETGNPPLGANGWLNASHPSADVEKLAEEIDRTVAACRLIEAPLTENIAPILARAFAEKDAEIARLKDKHQQSPEYLSMLQAMLDMKARAERAEAELAEAKDHIAIVTHPELGWAVSEEEHNKVVAERDQLLAEVERLSAPRSTLRSPADIKEIAELRAEVEQWKTTAAKDREENVDMRNEIADLRAQLAAAQGDSKVVDYLASMWDSQGKGHHICGRFVPNITGSFRDAIRDAARKEAGP